MAFVDELQLQVRAGNGGDGVVRWLHLKNKEFSGPSGGNGGKGGDVYAKAVRDIGVLERYVNKKEYAAGNGENGRARSQFGAAGDDLVFEVPIGTIITNESTHERHELLEEGQIALILNGGGGGKGNEHFKGSTNVRPEQSTKGKVGEEATLSIELQLIADAGLIGLPNAGKTSLLNALTNARAKVANYPFTTLDPNLGDIYGFLLADIPGLIEGAAEGKGLGHKFLRHIKRTKMLLHVISLEDDVVAAYKTVRHELESYSSVFNAKQEVVILSKTDLVMPEVVDTARAMLRAAGIGSEEHTIAVSVYDDASLKNLSDALTTMFKNPHLSLGGPTPK